VTVGQANRWVNEAFWNGRRVFVTGHTGFKGSWLVYWSQRMKAEVAGYALTPPTSPSLFEEADLGAAMENTIGDVRNGTDLLRTMSSHRPEVVFHLAAQSLVRTSYTDAAGTFAINVAGSVNLLEAIRRVTSARSPRSDPGASGFTGSHLLDRLLEAPRSTGFTSTTWWALSSRRRTRTVQWVGR
jgi:nucleoside-diphosphate-sugar epimerase